MKFNLVFALIETLATLAMGLSPVASGKSVPSPVDSSQNSCSDCLTTYFVCVAVSEPGFEHPDSNVVGRS